MSPGILRSPSGADHPRIANGTVQILKKYSISVFALVYDSSAFLANSEAWESSDLMMTWRWSPNDHDNRSERIDPRKHQTNIPLGVIEYEKLSLQIAGVEIPSPKRSLRWLLVPIITQSEFAFKAEGTVF